VSGARGEATIQVGEREVRILFTNRALAEVEGQLKRSIIAIAQGFGDGTSGITETAHLLRAGMEAARRDAGEGGPAISITRAFEVLEEAGFALTITAVCEAVAAVLGYGAGEPEPKNG